MPTVTVAGSSGGTTSSMNTAFTSTAGFPLTSTTSTRSQVIIGPSSTLASATSPGSSSSGVQSSGYAVGVSRGIIVTIGAGLGMALVY